MRYRGEHEDRQTYKYSVCGQRFWDNLGFEYRHVPRPYIVLALMVWGMGMPAGNIQMTLKHLGVGVHVDTIIRILGNSSTIPRWWQSMPRPSSPRVWGTSEAATRSTRRSAARSRIWSLSWASPQVRPSVGRVAHLGKVRRYPRCGRPGTWRVGSPSVHHGRSRPVPNRLQEGIRTLKGLRSIYIPRHPHSESHM